MELSNKLKGAYDLAPYVFGIGSNMIAAISSPLYSTLVEFAA
jgi:hypothetical protein